MVLGSGRRSKIKLPGPRPPRKGDFKPGHPKMGGRAPGTPNKVTKEIKTFFAELVSDPDVQEAFKHQIVDGEKGSMAAFLGAAAHVIGRPKETVQHDVTPTTAKLLAMAVRASREEKGKGEGKTDE